MLLVGEDPKKYIEDYSKQFQRDFLLLLRTSHGEKKVHMNNFYQEYIRDKEHVHMNATKWPSLTEFAKHLGREGICKVEEGDRGLEIQWIDDSAQAISRREDIKRKERLMKGDEDMEARMLERQIKQAREAAEKAGKVADEAEPRAGPQDVAVEPIKVSLSLGSKAQSKQQDDPKALQPDAPMEISTFSTADLASEPVAAETVTKGGSDEDEPSRATSAEPEAAASAKAVVQAPKLSMSLAGSKVKTNNPLMAKKNPLLKKKEVVVEPEKKMSNAERIMREEMERKRIADTRGGGGGKRIRLG